MRTTPHEDQARGRLDRPVTLKTLLVSLLAVLVASSAIAAGVAGRDGRDGRDGATGPRGEQGEQGPRGERGARGARGARGRRGEVERVEVAPGGGSSTFGDGTWEVGSDIEPGTYRAPGGSGCYWAIRNGPPTGDGIDDIEENGGFTKNVVVTVSAGQWFETNDCGEWSG